MGRKQFRDMFARSNDGKKGKEIAQIKSTSESRAVTDACPPFTQVAEVRVLSQPMLTSEF